MKSGGTGANQKRCFDSVIPDKNCKNSHVYKSVYTSVLCNSKNEGEQARARHRVRSGQQWQSCKVLPLPPPAWSPHADPSQTSKPGQFPFTPLKHRCPFSGPLARKFPENMPCGLLTLTRPPPTSAPVQRKTLLEPDPQNVGPGPPVSASPGSHGKCSICGLR